MKTSLQSGTYRKPTNHTMIELEYPAHKEKMDAIRSAFLLDVWPKVKLPEGASDKQVAEAMDRAWKQYLREQNL